MPVPERLGKQRKENGFGMTPLDDGPPRVLA